MAQCTEGNASSSCGQRIEVEESDFLALGPGGDLGREKLRSVEKLKLADVAETVDREHVDDLELRSGLFPGFPGSALFGVLANLHEPGGQCPEAAARLDRPPAHQQLVFPGCDDAHDDLWVLVGDVIAVGAHETRTIVPFGNCSKPWTFVSCSHASRRDDPYHGARGRAMARAILRLTLRRWIRDPSSIDLNGGAYSDSWGSASSWCGPRVAV